MAANQVIYLVIFDQRASDNLTMFDSRVALLTIFDDRASDNLDG